jgi:hypothetical protein
MDQTPILHLSQRNLADVDPLMSSRKGSFMITNDRSGEILYDAEKFGLELASHRIYIRSAFFAGANDRKVRTRSLLFQECCVVYEWPVW